MFEISRITRFLAVAVSLMLAVPSLPACARSSTVTGEYVQLLNLYSEYLGDAGEKQKARQFRLEAQQLGEQLGHRAPTGSTVTLMELEAGRLR